VFGPGAGLELWRTGDIQHRLGQSVHLDRFYKDIVECKCSNQYGWQRPSI
jgi:hypothetical protein